MSAPGTFAPTRAHPEDLFVGLDVGSTTVKFVVVDPVTDEILLQDYRRHETRQAETCLAMLGEMAERLPDVPASAMRVFVTGSGGVAISRHLGARFVQEVNAVCLAVERLHPRAQSVIELGGQDAKIIVFREDESTGRKRKIPSMNDKCAGGTGAVIDKIAAKLGLPATALGDMGYLGLKLHPVAGKCGVFAETDINGLQKQGVAADELMASLFESIVQQNLAVLTRGNTLRPEELLLGGPNCFIRGMQEAWRHHLPELWRERRVAFDETRPMEELVVVPPGAQYFAALGAVEFGRREVVDEPDLGVYRGPDELAAHLRAGRRRDKQVSGRRGLWTTPDELARFKEAYRPEPWTPPPALIPGAAVRAYMGIDGGSTSTKGALIDGDATVIARAYQLSHGNPIQDTVEIVAKLEAEVASRGGRLEIVGVGTTGYAKDVLKDVLGADVALVETVAHAQAGLLFHPETDVIVDVGGQDIKLIILKNGQVKDFRLNTQCSAGNGYFLQSTAQSLGHPVEDYAEVAFGAERMPLFGYGCAVFMQSDIVDFQRQGWAAAEIMAGLCDVLPRNIWLYVSQIPNLPRLGQTFLLQGGTQHNLAAVKAQVDFIRSRFRGSRTEPRVIVHRFCGEAGAIGAAVEARRRHREMEVPTTFIGFARARQIVYRSTRSEATRCYFCKNKCLRTFIDIQTADAVSSNVPLVPLAALKRASKVPLAPGEQRLIVATCEKGTVEDVDEMRQIKSGIEAVKRAHPNFTEICAREAFRPAGVTSVADPLPSAWWPGRRAARQRARRQVRIGLPRVLNMYSLAMWFTAYFEALGLPPDHLVWSDPTSAEMYREGAKRGAIDPCFPSKIGIPHVQNLLAHKHEPERPLRYIFFPMIDSLPTFLEGVVDRRACPTVTATPAAVKAAFTKESDLFAAAGVEFLDTFLNFAEPGLLARQLLGAFGPRLGVSPVENARACQVAWEHYEVFWARQRRQARSVLDHLEREDGIGVVVLGRPYHDDPGVGHEIPAELQKLGFPVFTPDSLPRDSDLLDRLFGDEVRRGEVTSAFHIDDVWKNAYSENTNKKVWAAKYTARHPNLVALELSSFKCGHDAPIYSLVEEIIETSGTPYFAFKDLDENRPAGSIRLRVETIAYFLGRYRETLARRRRKTDEIERQLIALAVALRETGVLARASPARPRERPCSTRATTDLSPSIHHP